MDNLPNKTSSTSKWIPADKGRSPREVNIRWTADLALGGWTPISDIFLDRYSELVPPITNSEAILIIHLMRHKWDAHWPYPSFSRLAKRMGLGAAAVRHQTRSLEKKGYLVREFSPGGNSAFNLSSLFKLLEAMQAKDSVTKGRKLARGFHHQKSLKVSGGNADIEEADAEKGGNV